MTIYLDKPPSGIVASLTTDSLGQLRDARRLGLRALPTGGYYVQTYNSLGYGDELYNNVPASAAT